MSVRPLARRIAGATLALLAATGAAHAESVNPAKPQSVVAALQTAGYKAVLTKDSSGDPKISSAASGASFTILFYGCEKNVDCTSIQFVAGYTVKTKPTVEKMNEWNMSHRFSSAYRDADGDPNITWDVAMQGGVSQPLFEQIVSRWTDVMGTFQTFVDW